MFDENQLVKVKWHNGNKKHYESLGYNFTKYGDEFCVKAKDLMRGSKIKVEAICDFCGKKYYPTFKNYNSKSNKKYDACKDCIGLKSSNTSVNNRAKEHFDKIKEICNNHDYELVTKESQYKNIDTKIKYICKKHGAQNTSVKLFLKAGGCAKCNHDSMIKNKFHTREYVKSIIEKYNGNKWVNENEYIGSTVRNLMIKCGLCGKIFITSFNSYATEKSAQRKCWSCSCKESKGEEQVRKVLEKYSIKFESEKRFDDCRDIKPLPFDFYLPGYNMCIEFDGQCHYEDRGFGDYNLRVMHDDIKNKYCKNNNIKLLRIPYWKGSKTEEIIIKELNL